MKFLVRTLQSYIDIANYVKMKIQSNSRSARILKIKMAAEFKMALKLISLPLSLKCIFLKIIVFWWKFGQHFP
jgi:hypothetical protein